MLKSNINTYENLLFQLGAHVGDSVEIMFHDAKQKRRVWFLNSARVPEAQPLCKL